MDSRETQDKFDWDKFLESRDDLIPAPNFAFQHVDKCQQSLLEVGMMVEVETCNGSHKGKKPRFWLATVTMKCGPFLRLKHVGQEDASKEIWTDPSKVEVHPVGYSSSKGLLLEPPAELKHLKLEARAAELIEEHRAADCEVSLLSPALQMKSGLTVEVEDLYRPRTVWLAEVKRNVGGRLLIRYLLPDSISLTSDQEEAVHEWIFCLSPRLHWRGWADSSWAYQPPVSIAPLSNQWSTLTDQCRSTENLSIKPWQFDLDAPAHSHKVGDQLRALDPRYPLSLQPATVTQVIDEQRYVIQFDSRVPEEACDTEKDTSITLNCFAARGDDADECVFETNMALEVVNPFRPSEICVGIITGVEENGAVLSISPQLDGEQSAFMISATSHDLFPVGWCDSQNYPLKGPVHQLSITSASGLNPDSQMPAEEKVCSEEPSATSAGAEGSGAPSGTANVSFWCPKIYFNYRCFSGPHLSRIRVAALPRSVGPGPIALVMKEVLSQLMNGAYKPGSVLKHLQGEPADPLPPGTSLEPMKAKYRQTTYRGSVPVACTAASVPDYCRWVCEKLQCCPYLFGPELVGDPCPHRCCILARAVWHHKKKAPNWRHRRFVDILKSSENLTPAEVEASMAAAAAAAAGPAVAKILEPVITESAEPSPDEDSGAQSGADEEQDQPAAKKLKGKRGRPKKILHQAEGTPNSTKVDQAGPPSSNSHRRIIPYGIQPHLWSCKDVYRFLLSSDCRPLADRLFEQEVDGPSLLLLRPADVADYVTLNYQLAFRLIRLIDSLRLTYSA